jgi:hypothetical protein
LPAGRLQLVAHRGAAGVGQLERAHVDVVDDDHHRADDDDRQAVDLASGADRGTGRRRRDASGVHRAREGRQR